MDSLETIKKVAELSSLSFSEEDFENQGTQFEKVLHYIAEIDKLDLAGVEPLISVSNTENVFRDDIAGEPLKVDMALRNSNRKNDNFFKVPKVIE